MGKLIKVTPAGAVSLVDAAGGGGGEGFQFNAGTYGADNVGDWSIIEADSVISGSLTNLNSLEYPTNLELYSMAINTGHGILFTADPNNVYDNGLPVVAIEQVTDEAQQGGWGLSINVKDLYGDNFAGGIYVNASVGAGGGGAEGINCNVTADTGNTGGIHYGGRFGVTGLGDGGVFGVFGAATAVGGADYCIGGSFGASGSVECVGIQVGAGHTSGTAYGTVTGASVVTVANSTYTCFGISVEAAMANNVGSGSAVLTGILSQTKVFETDHTGNAVSINAYAEKPSGTSGKEIAIQAKTSGNLTGANSVLLQCVDSANARKFEVWEDGTIHGPTGGSITWDL